MNHLKRAASAVALVAAACGLIEAKGPTFPEPGMICEEIQILDGPSIVICAKTAEELARRERAAAEGQSYTVLRRMERP
jgi:hypothetical protein